MLFGVPIFPDRERSVLSLSVWSWTNKQRTGGASVNGRACCADPTGKPLMEVSTCESLALSIVLLSQGVVVLVGCWLLVWQVKTLRFFSIWRQTVMILRYLLWPRTIYKEMEGTDKLIQTALKLNTQTAIITAIDAFL